MVGDNIINTIANVTRNSNRNISIEIKTSSKTTLRIINIYAPYMGYNNGERVKYWEDIYNRMWGSVK